MKVTSRRWKRKEELQQLNMAGRRMGLDTGKHFSKPKPQHFQRQVLDTFEQKWAEVRKKFEASSLTTIK
jgi:hypothetical protein